MKRILYVAVITALFIFVLFSVQAMMKGVGMDGTQSGDLSGYGKILWNLFGTLQKPVDNYVHTVLDLPGGNISSLPSPPPMLQENVLAEDGLTVEFIDVGQADCTLVYSGGEVMLIDAGNIEDGPLVVQYLKDKGIYHLDYAVITHAHEDHYGGMSDVIRDMNVDYVLTPKIDSEWTSYTRLKRQIQSSSATEVTPVVGGEMNIGDAVVTVISCDYIEDAANINESSIVLLMEYAETSWLFMADAETINEEHILESGYNVDVDVLKVGHHGSYTSSSPAFLAAVTPEVSVISCGQDNGNDHPHDVTLRHLKAIGATILRTNQLGTIIMHTDGLKIDISSEETDTDGVKDW